MNAPLARTSFRPCQWLGIRVFRVCFTLVYGILSSQNENEESRFAEFLVCGKQARVTVFRVLILRYTCSHEENMGYMSITLPP